jgi:hypothetical protein
MYFYQKNFIYDVSSYPKTKDTTNNSVIISNINISDLNYYFSEYIRPQILLSNGNFSAWGAKDVLLSENWNIGYNSSTGLYELTINVSNRDITNYDINQIKYLIFLDKINVLVINSNEENFKDYVVRNLTKLSIKFNNNSSKEAFLPLNTFLMKTNTYITITPQNYYGENTINFSSNAQQEIILPFLNFPYFINIKVNRPTNITDAVLKLELIIVDDNNTSNIIQTYYFSSPSGQRLNTFSLIPLYSANPITSTYSLNSNSQFKLRFSWTTDGTILYTENTSLTIQSAYNLPMNSLKIYF